MAASRPGRGEGAEGVEHQRRRRRQQRRVRPREHHEESRRADANGIAHTGAGANIADAHTPGDRRAEGRQDRLPAVHRALVSGQRADRHRDRAGHRQDRVARRRHDRSGRRRARERRHPPTPPLRSTSSSSRTTTATERRPRSSASRCAARSECAAAGRASFRGVPESVRAHGARCGRRLVYGHGTHTVQGVEVYKGKPILYAIGHSAFDQPGYEKSKDGLVIHTVVRTSASGECRLFPFPATRTTT